MKHKPILKGLLSKESAGKALKSTPAFYPQLMTCVDIWLQTRNYFR
jgi:hypothetical protein